MNLKDFLDFADFVKNVEKYEARVQSLKDENDRLETNIKLTAEVVDIPRTKELTEKLLTEARVTLASAKEEAKTIVERAKASYDKRLAEVTTKEAAAENALANSRTVLTEAQTLHSTLIAELQRQLSSVDKQQKALQASQTEVDERLVKLKSVMG